jgi:hypothetical protein
MPPQVQLIFASNWICLGNQPPGSPSREFTHEMRAGHRIRLEQGQHRDLPAIWVDWSDGHLPTPLNSRSPSGLSVALAAAVEASPDAANWLVLLSHVASPHSELILDSRIQTLADNTIVVWMSADNELLAAGFSCELYSELIRLDSAHALNRLLRRYPVLQVGEPYAQLPGTGQTPAVDR